MHMIKESIVRITMDPCPKCGGKKYRYNPPEIRKHYKGEIVVGKYECLICGEQVS